MPSWKKIITSGSSALLLNVTASSFTGSFTGSFLGTGSYATNALSASYAPGGGITISNNTDNYILTATGTANSINGESNLTFDGSTFTVTGKSALNGQVSQTVGSLSIIGTTASLDLSTGNFFTLTLVAGATNINTTNITAGQTTTVLITSAVGATVTFPTSVKQPSGSSYTPTSSAGAKDILTLISYDSSNVYIANVKNLI